MEKIKQNQPSSLGDFFLSFCALSLKGFGGVMPFAEHMIVEEKKWLTREEFLADWAVAQTLPGPPVINLSIALGSRYFGIRGALAGVAGLVTIPLFLAILLANVYAYFGGSPYFAGALQGMGAVAAGLFIGAGVKLAFGLKNNPLGVLVCCCFGTLVFAGIVIFHWPLVFLVLSLGGISCVLAYYKLVRNPD